MNILFKKIRVTALLTSLGLMLGIGFLLDYKKPRCVAAECATVNPILPIIENHDQIKDWGGNDTSMYFTLGKIRDDKNVRRRVCFLNYVGMQNVGSDDKNAKCQIYEDTAGDWNLKASGTGDGDLWAKCGASCLCWPESDGDTWCEETNGD